MLRKPWLPGGEAGVMLEQQYTLGQKGHRGRSNLPTQLIFQEILQVLRIRRIYVFLGLLDPDP
jgi:hypothetical protein